VKKLPPLVIALIFMISRCAYIPLPPAPISELGPNVRIGIAENLTSLEFETDSNVDIFDGDERLLAESVSGKRWRVTLQNAAPAPLSYRLLYRETDEPVHARQLAATLEQAGFSSKIKQIKKRAFRNGQLLTIPYYQVLLKPIFNSEAEARQFQKQIQPQFSTTILPFFDARPAGRIILTNESTGMRVESATMIRVMGKLFKLTTVSGKDFHFEREQQRTYRYHLEFWIDQFGGLTVVNQLPIELYLRGVVGSEMNPEFPLEALKAQAVTARGYTIAWLDKLHRMAPFDLCDEVHCHVYGGVEHEAESVTEAVMQTRGQVLIFDDQICDTRYAAVCGGHSENNEDVWGNTPQPYLRGRLDAKSVSPGSIVNLSDESNVRRWIESSPDVFCNTIQLPVPEALNYTKKYFRWTERYSRPELSQIIAQKTGQNIGLLNEIVPLERGVSGRLKKVELRGTLKSIVVEKELQIRNAISPNYLYSSCFVVDRQGNDFILKGAGWGHGVGMCQTGAGVMAWKGFDYRSILQHYYRGSKIIRIY